jgi:DNA-binding protein YbaB
MFNKLKQFKDLRDQAKSMQAKLAEELIEVDHKGLKIKMNGNLEIQSVSTPEGLSKDSLDNIVKDGVNEIIKKAQKVMARKMQEMGGFPSMS